MKKRLISTAVALAALGLLGAVSANEKTNFDLTVPVVGTATTLTYSNLSAIDWNEAGSGVVLGLGPFSQTVIPVGTKFQFLYQANAVSFTGAGTPADMDTNANGLWDPDSITLPPPLGTINYTRNWELTVAVSLWEEVIASGVDANGDTYATFAPTYTWYDNTSRVSQVSIFYDNNLLTDGGATPGGGVAANSADGTGFDGGIEIARFTVTDGIPGFKTLTTFTATDPAAGQGSPKVYAELVALADFVNEDFLKGLAGSIFDWEWQGNIQYPPSTSATTGMHIGGNESLYPSHTNDLACAGPGTCDIVFKVDGQNEFTYKTPEPATTMLFGAGLIGMGWFARRRRAKT